MQNPSHVDQSGGDRVDLSGKHKFFTTFIHFKMRMRLEIKFSFDFTVIILIRVAAVFCN